MRCFAFLFSLLVFSLGSRNVAAQVVTTDSVSSAKITLSLHPIMPLDSSEVVYRGMDEVRIRKFYAMRQGRLLWTTDGRVLPAADSMISFIRNCRYYGLLRKNYHYNEINDRRNRLYSPAQLQRFDALLTDAYLSVMTHLDTGMLSSATLMSDSLLGSRIDDAIGDGTVTRRLIEAGPASTGYRMLLRGLKLLLDSLNDEDREAMLANNPGSLTDIASKVRTIEVNLERWRSAEHTFGDRYILVNIPAFMLYVIVDDTVVLESRVIVGAEDSPTHELSSVIECFITYPYWNVPRKIALAEYLPAIQKNISFLEQYHFDVLDKKGNVLAPDSIDWMKFNKNNFPVRLRQREGTENALGVLKFVFDNPYATYLHDTSAKRLFQSNVRAFSHGCIRMEKAVLLAHYLVTGQVNKKSRYIERFLEEQSRHTIELKKPIPIHVKYFTCEMRDNALIFYADAYGWDQLMLDRLYDAADALNP